MEAELGVGAQHKATTAIRAIDDLGEDGAQLPEAINRLIKHLGDFQKWVLENTRAPSGPACAGDSKETVGES